MVNNVEQTVERNQFFLLIVILGPTEMSVGWISEALVALNLT